jgi:hypothetical protein
MSANFKRLSLVQSAGAFGFVHMDFVATGLADSLESVGNALANTATSDLPTAQAQFKKFTNELKLSKDEQIIAIREMDNYETALIDQAEQMGINLKTTSGLIDEEKLLAFARGEGEIALRLAEQAQRDMNDAVDNAAASFVDHQGGLNQNKDDVMAWAKAQAENTEDATDSWEDYWDGQEFSMDHYLDGLEEQQEAALEWRNNLAKLAGELPEEIYRKVVEMEEGGAALVAGLTDGVNDEEERRRFINSFDSAGFDASTALGNGLSRGLPSGGFSIRALMEGRGPTSKNGGYITFGGGFSGFASGGFVSGLGTARSDSIPAMLSNGEYVINARATANNRKLLDAINSNSNIPNSAPNINVTINASPGMDERELANMVSRKIAFEVRKGAF